MRVALAIIVAFAAVAYATRNPTPNSTHVMVRMELDNTVKEVNKSMAVLKKNIAKELCGVPETDVTVLKVLNDDTKVAGIGNTQTLIYAACKAPTSKLEAVLDDCEDWWNRHQVKDETQDKTSWWRGGEVEVDDIDCKYVESGKFEYFSNTDAKKAVEQKSGAASAAAGAFIAAAAGAAALLVL